MWNIVDKCILPFFLLVTGNILSVFIRWNPEAWGNIHRMSHLHSSYCSAGAPVSPRSSSCKPCADVSNTLRCVKHWGIWMTSLPHTINLAEDSDSIAVTLTSLGAEFWENFFCFSLINNTSLTLYLNSLDYFQFEASD